MAVGGKKPVPDVAKADSGHSRLIETFCQRWKSTHGADYPFDGGRDGSAAKKVLAMAKGDVTAAARVIDVYLLDDTSFYAGHPLSKLPSAYPGCVAQLATANIGRFVMTPEIQRELDEYAAMVAGGGAKGVKTCS